MPDSKRVVASNNLEYNPSQFVRVVAASGREDKLRLSEKEVPPQSVSQIIAKRKKN